jgi:hypothetical protein
MPACLIAESGHAAALDQRAVRVGSDAQADIPILGGLGLAPLHYEILPNEHGYWIRGLNQDFPLLINGRQVEVALLQNEDVISAGALQLMFRHESGMSPPLPVIEQVPTTQPNYAALPEFAQPNEAPPDPVSSYRPPVLSSTHEDDGDERFSTMSESERRIGRLMEEAEARTAKHLELLKKEQNFGGAVMAALVTLAASIFAYSTVCNFRWKLFLLGILALGYAIGWVVKVVGKGQDKCFGQLAGGTALAAILLVNFLAVSGLFQMTEEVTEPVEITAADESDYNSQSVPEEEEDAYDGSGWASAVNAEDFAEQGRLAALQATGAASEAGRLAMFEPAPGYTADEEMDEEISSDSTVTVVQTVGFFWIMFGPKSLVAYFLMTAAAYRAAFRSLSSHEASILHGARV